MIIIRLYSLELSCFQAENMDTYFWESLSTLFASAQDITQKSCVVDMKTISHSYEQQLHS